MATAYHRLPRSPGVLLVVLCSVFTLITAAAHCRRVSSERLGSDVERLLGAALEVRSLKQTAERRLGVPAGGRACEEPLEVDFRLEFRARVMLQNFRTVPSFERRIAALERGQLRLDQRELEETGAMFRLAELTPPDWQTIDAGAERRVGGTFAYLRSCESRDYRFERIVPVMLPASAPGAGPSQ